MVGEQYILLSQVCFFVGSYLLDVLQLLIIVVSANDERERLLKFIHQPNFLGFVVVLKANFFIKVVIQIVFHHS